jgi:hypothetical protein
MDARDEATGDLCKAPSPLVAVRQPQQAPVVRPRCDRRGRIGTPYSSIRPSSASACPSDMFFGTG